MSKLPKELFSLSVSCVDKIIYQRKRAQKQIALTLIVYYLFSIINALYVATGLQLKHS